MARGGASSREEMEAGKERSLPNISAGRSLLGLQSFDIGDEICDALLHDRIVILVE
jgi:hypothetical protein